MKKRIKKTLILINIIFLQYYSLQLILFTDEFTINNFGFFNHAIAGISEILGILLFSLSAGLFFVLIKGYKDQLPLFFIIFLFEFLVSLNLWRYVIFDSPGETTIEIIMFNAILFTFATLSMFLLIYNSYLKS
tara:strand:+ start:384 stop:782 length:399 start_codon:yes stop_codon:yes gene_type:complete